MSGDFQLQALLELRTSERDDAESALARATGELGAARDELDSREERRRALERRLDAARQLPLDSDLRRLQRNDEYVQALDVELEQVRAAVDEQRAAVEARLRDVSERRSELAEREADLEAVVSRKREWERERERARRRREDAEMDDVAVRRWHEREKK